MGKIITVKLADVATWERSKKNKIYPAGSVTLQVSATKGQLAYLEEAQEVPARYAVIMLKDGIQIMPKYFYMALQSLMPDFLRRVQTGLNIVPSVLEEFELKYHESMEEQEKFIAEYEYYGKYEKSIEKQIEELKDLKQTLLAFCFPEEGANVPRWRF